jgi:hypothetical protein
VRRLANEYINHGYNTYQLALRKVCSPEDVGSRLLLVEDAVDLDMFI